MPQLPHRLSGESRKTVCNCLILSFQCDDELLRRVQRYWIEFQPAVAVTRRLTRRDIESAIVQWAHQRALAEKTVRKRPTSVRARRLSGEHGTIAASEDGDGESMNLEQSTLSQGYSVDAAEVCG